METPAVQRFPQTSIQTPVPPATPAPYAGISEESSREPVRNEEALTDSWAQAMTLLHSNDLEQASWCFGTLCAAMEAQRSCRRHTINLWMSRVMDTDYVKIYAALLTTRCGCMTLSFAL
jgi:hypothetical protein